MKTTTTTAAAAAAVTSTAVKKTLAKTAAARSRVRYCDLATWTMQQIATRRQNQRRVRNVSSSDSTKRSSSNNITIADAAVGAARNSSFLFDATNHEFVNNLYHECRVSTAVNFDALNSTLEAWRIAFNQALVYDKLRLGKTEAYRVTMSRLNRKVDAATGILHCRLNQMLRRYIAYIERYSSIHANFFAFLLERNVQIGAGPDQLHVLAHLINYSPSITLAQFYFYVFRNEFSLSEVCEMFLFACANDELFVARTRYILHRYQCLGDGRSRIILDKLCTTELLLFPLLSRRCTNVSLDEILDDDGYPVLQNGQSTSCDRMYETLFELADPMRLITEYYLRDVVDATADESVVVVGGDGGDGDSVVVGKNNTTINVTPYYLMLSRVKSDRDIFVLLNFLYWRYDGSSYVDSSTDIVFGVTREQPFSDILTSSLLVHTRQLESEWIAANKEKTSAALDEQMRANSQFPISVDGSSRQQQRQQFLVERGTDDDDDYDDTPGDAKEQSAKRKRQSKKNSSCKQRQQQKKRKNNSGLSEEFNEEQRSKHERRLRKTFALFADYMSQTYRAAFRGGSIDHNSAATTTASGRGGLAHANYMPGQMLDKFVRYTDNRSSGRVMLNLYLNRFELCTPAASDMLTINYEDTNPPYRFRYNERCDARIERFVRRSIEIVHDYFGEVCSRDCINHYLYSHVVAERTKPECEDTPRGVGNPSKGKKSSVESNDGDPAAAALSSNDTDNNNDDDDDGDDDDDDDDLLEDLDAKRYDRRFVCDVNDLLVLFDASLTLQDARRILDSHPEARRFVLAIVNLAHVFGRSVISRSDAVNNLARILTNAGNGADATTLLYAPLACRSKTITGIYDNDDGDYEYYCYNNTNGGASLNVGDSAITTTTRRIKTDLYEQSEQYLRRNATRWGRCDTSSTTTADRDDNNVVVDNNRSISSNSSGSREQYSSSAAAAATTVDGTNNSRGGGRVSEMSKIMQDLARFRRRAKLQFRVPQTTVVSAIGGGADETNGLVGTIGRMFVRSLADTRSSSSSSSSSNRRTTIANDPDNDDDDEDANAGSADAMREFLSSSRLDEYLNEHARDLSNILEGLIDTEIVRIATLYLYVLARERQRHYKFCPRNTSCEVCRGEDQRAAAAAAVVATVTNNNNNKKKKNENVGFTRVNLFERLTRNARDCRKALRALYPEMYLHSYDTNSLAEGLALHVNAMLERTERVPHEIGFSISLAIVTLWIFSRGDVDVMLFLLRFVTACRFPGQFLKSVLLLQGTSDSGKSEFVSDVLRMMYSSSLHGTLSNATLRQGMKDEINTDLMSMMRSHVCQCDEPEKLNSELFKTLISRTRMKCRNFFSQQAHYLCNLAKIVLTVNDSISMRSDAGVITRLKYCIRMVHKFKTLHSYDHDTAIDFTDKHSTPSVAYQFATKCFAQGVNFTCFRVGMFLIVENYCMSMCTYNDSTYALADALSRRMSENWRIVNKNSSNNNDDDDDDDDGNAVCGDGDVFRRPKTPSSTRSTGVNVVATSAYARAKRNIDEYNHFRKVIFFGLLPNAIQHLQHMESSAEKHRRHTRRNVEIRPQRRSSSSSAAEDGYETTTETILDDDDHLLDDSNDSQLFDDDDDLLDNFAMESTDATLVTNTNASSFSAATTAIQSVFGNTMSIRLGDPLVIDRLPRSMIRDARNLHITLDPYEWLVRRYDIVEDSTVSITEIAIANFLREFLNSSGCNVHRSTMRDVVTKMKERIKTEYPRTFNSVTSMFNLTFRERELTGSSGGGISSGSQSRRSV